MVFKLKFKFGLLEAFLSSVIILFIAIITFNYFSELHLRREDFKSNSAFICDIISKETKRFLTPAEEIVRISSQLYGENRFNFSDYDNVNALFMPFMETYPYITSINIGDDKGNGYLIMKLGNIWKNRIKKYNEKNHVTWVTINENHDVIDKSYTIDDYDPRNRPWYIIAKDNDGFNWTSPYIFRTTRDVGITLSRNLSKDGNKKLIIGVDVLLKDISYYLNKIASNYKHANIKILTDDLKILASSEEGFEDFLKKNDPSLITLTPERDEVLYNAFKTFKETKKKFFSIKIKDKSYFIYVDNFLLSRENKLFTCIYIPESIFLSHYKDTLIAHTVILFIFLFLGVILMLKRYIFPLKSISHHLMKLPIDSPLLPETKRNDEIGIFTQMFNKMIKEIEHQRELLLLSEKSYRLLFENNPLPLFIVSESQLKILEVNSRAVHLLGYPKEKLLSMTIEELKTDDTKIKDGKDTLLKNISILKKSDGSYIYVEITDAPIFWQNTKALLLLALDVTEKIFFEEQLRHQEKLQSVGLLAAGIAHNFNNILTAILGYAELLEIKMQDTDPNIRYIREIISATQKAAKLVSDLLTFSRKENIHLEELDLNEVIKEFSPSMEIILGKTHALEVILSSKPLIILGDKNQLGQVLINFTSNAKDALTKPGKITITTDTIKVSKSQFPELEDGDYALLKFSDTGKGMDKNTLNRIFEPFYTTKEVGKGTGLGLSTVYGIIKQLNGEIKVESVVNQGTTFFVYLPLVKSKE